MKKIPSIFQRLERSSLVNTDNVLPECTWVFEPNAQCIITIKRDGTPVRWKNGQWSQRRTLKSKLDPGTEGIPQPRDFEPCQPTPGYDDESKQWEWPGWVPLDTQYKKLVDEAVLSRGGMYKNEDGFTFELCGPKINGNPEGWDTHHLFTHGGEPILFNPQSARPQTAEELVAVVTAIKNEGLVIYDGTEQHRMAKIKRRDLGLDWPIKVDQKIDL